MIISANFSSLQGSVFSTNNLVDGSSCTSRMFFFIVTPFFFFSSFSPFYLLLGTIYVTSCGYVYNESGNANATFVIASPLICSLSPCISILQSDNIFINGMGNGSISGCAPFFFSSSITNVTISDIKLDHNNHFYLDQYNLMICFARVSFSGEGVLFIGGNSHYYKNCHFLNYVVGQKFDGLPLFSVTNCTFEGIKMKQN